VQCLLNEIINAQMIDKPAKDLYENRMPVVSGASIKPLAEEI
jgi:hypothetical protein